VFSSSQSAFYFLNGQIQFFENKRIKVTIIVPDDGFIDELRSVFPITKIIISPIVREINLLKDIKSLFFFVKTFYRNKFDIIHLHTPKAGLLGSVAARITFHKKIVFHLHGLVSIKFDQLINGLTLKMEMIPFLLSHKVISVSKSLENLCIVNGLVNKEKISTLNSGSINGIDSSNRFNPLNFKVESKLLKEELDIEDKFIIGFLGRVNFDKGIDTFIRVANELITRHINLVFLIVGPNELDVDFDEYLKNHAKFSYRYIDRTYNPELYISIFDLFLFPTVREGFGLVAAEANALEKPVIGFEISGLIDAIENNRTGFLVDPLCELNLVTAIEKYIQHPRLLLKHGKSGRKRVVSKFQPKSLWEEQYKFYIEFLDS